MKLVYICSKYRADSLAGYLGNVREAIKGMLHALREGCAPVAPHVMYHFVLDDRDIRERGLGMAAGMELLERCDELWVWGEDISEGMQAEIMQAMETGIPVKRFDSKGMRMRYQEMGG